MYFSRDVHEVVHPEAMLITASLRLLAACATLPAASLVLFEHVPGAGKGESAVREGVRVMAQWRAWKSLLAPAPPDTSYAPNSDPSSSPTSAVLELGLVDGYIVSAPRLSCDSSECAV